MTRLFWALCLCTLATAAMAEPQLRLLGAFDWDMRARWFGGWSGIELSADGSAMLAISDRGYLVETRTIREGDVLTRVDVTRGVPIQSEVAIPITDKTFDAEGLAVDAQGRVYLSFEFDHRVERIDLETGLLGSRISIPFPLDLNGGVEALAVDAEGTLHALTERKPEQNAPFDIYRYRNGAWEVAARLPRSGPFLPVGADFDDTGRLWLLERAVTPLGFRSQIRLVTLGTTPLTAPALLTSMPGLYDNLEGLSVWRNPAGDLRVTVISDDNFLRMQRTQIVEYAVEE